MTISSILKIYYEDQVRMYLIDDRVYTRVVALTMLNFVVQLPLCYVVTRRISAVGALTVHLRYTHGTLTVC